MPATFGYGEKVIGLDTLRVCTFNASSGAQGTPEQVPEANKLTMKRVLESDETKANLLTTSFASFPRHYTFELNWAGLSFAVMEILLGPLFVQAPESGTTPNRTRVAYNRGGLLLPYFSVAGYSLGEDASGLIQGLWKCKLEEAEDSMAEDGKYMLSNTKGRALAYFNGTNWDFGPMKRLETGAAFDNTAFQALFA